MRLKAGSSFKKTAKAEKMEADVGKGLKKLFDEKMREQAATNQ